MLDVSLEHVSFAYPRGGFALRDVNLTFRASTHTAVTGLGASTLLKLVSGYLKPDQGEIRIGTRAITAFRPGRRPLLYATSEPGVPGRWSVQHALVAAVRQRTLDRPDRQQEYDLAVSKWGLERFLQRRVDTLSSSECVRLAAARIELLRPGILIGDRVLSDAEQLADELYRTMRVIGATVITAPASLVELGHTDRVLVLSGGRVAQDDSAARLFTHPADEAVAAATGEVNVIPITIRDGVVESAIGSWSSTAFTGTGVALARPDDFTVAGAAEESDLIVGVEEAVFDRGQWMVRAILSGAFVLRVRLPRETTVYKGKLLALRYDPGRFSLMPRDIDVPRASAPTDVVPPLGETR